MRDWSARYGPNWVCAPKTRVIPSPEDQRYAPNCAVRYGTVRYGKVQVGYGAVRYGTVRYAGILESLRYGTVRYGTVRYAGLGRILKVKKALPVVPVRC